MKKNKIDVIMGFGKLVSKGKLEVTDKDLSLIHILKKNTGIGKLLFTGALLLSLASFGFMAQTAHLGGLIRHSELQNGNSTNTNSKEKDATGKEVKEQEKDDDD